MTYLAAVAIALVGYIVWSTWAVDRDRKAERSAFADERQQWVRERRDLNTRIQMPQVAPFLLEDEGPSEDDMPVMPDFVVDEAELEKANRALAEAGYEDGPAA
jgi:hypothetical protein